MEKEPKMNDSHYSQFRDIFNTKTANSPDAWAEITVLMEDIVDVLKNEAEPALTKTVRAAERATALLYCAVVTAKRENIELVFFQLINNDPGAKGKSFGTRLLNWTLSKMNLKLADDLNVAWSGIRQHMADSLDMMIRELEHVGHITVDQAVAWIQSRGGIGKLHMAYLSYIAEEKAQKERDRQIGEQIRRTQQANEAGFETITEYDAHLTKKKTESLEIVRRAKFPDVKKKLVENGTITIAPTEYQLLIFTEGKLYAISDGDEYQLLSCYASTV